MPRSLLRLTAALLAVAMLTAGCVAATAASLGNREFLSVDVTDGGATRPLVPGTRIRLTFSGTDLGAQAGCNSIGGTYRIEAGRLIFDGGAMTEMGCDPERHAQDDWLETLLSAEPTVRLDGDELVIERGTTVIRLADRTVVEPDANLVGPTWTLVSIIQGDAVSSIPDGQAATVSFAADGTLELFAGCNRGGGTWRAVGGGLEIGPIGLTKMACDGPSATIEAAVLQVLEVGSVGASIRADILMLQASGNGLQLQAR